MFTQEQRVGLFILAGLAVLVFSIVMIGDISFQRRYKVYVVFENIEGLPDKAPVKVAGVEIGKVGRITLTDSRAQVEILVKSAIAIHQGAHASIVSTGIIGSKFMELTLGDKALPRLRDGDTIYGESVMSYDQLFAKAMEGIEELRLVLSEVRADGAFGNNLNGAVVSIRRIAKRFDEITRQHQDDITVTLVNLREISEGLKGTISTIQEIAEKINTGEGVIGTLVNDEEMGENLKSTIKEARKVLDRINLVRTYWDYRLRYDFEESQYRSDLGLKIYPRDDKYYHLGVNNAGDTKDDPNDTEDKNTFTAEIGKHFGPFTLHAGAIRSKGGIGVAYRPWDKMEFTTDAYYFSRKEPEEKPIVDMGGRFRLNDWAYVGGYVGDVGVEKDVNAYMNVVFEDKDIAYLLGLIGLSQ